MKRAEINVPTACGMDWAAMTKSGNDPARFCGECQKHVHDLSAMTKAEATTLLSSSTRTEGLCVRYLYDRQGNVAFTDDAVVVEPKALTRFAKAKRYVAAAVTLALPMSLNACMGAYQPPPPRAAVPSAAPTTPAAAPVAADADADAGAPVVVTPIAK